MRLKILQGISRFFAVGAWIMLLAGPLLAHYRALEPLYGFLILLLSVPFGAISLVAGVAGRFCVQARSLRHWGPALAGAGPLLVLLPFMAEVGNQPVINDVTTDLMDPPVFVSAARREGNEGRDFAYAAETRAVAEKAYADLGARNYPGRSSGEVRAVAGRLARSLPGWTVDDDGADPGRLEGFAESGLFRFRDDWVLRFRDEAGGARVDMRSKSREGKGDLGANAARIREFLRGLDRELGNGPGSE
jgi:uncharacterized protein (DUF1499 family)